MSQVKDKQSDCSQQKIATTPTLSELFYGDPQKLRTLMLDKSIPDFERTQGSLQGSYSAHVPSLYISGEADEGLVKAGIWLLAKELYLNGTLDRADLSAWLDDEFPISIHTVSLKFLLRHREAPGVFELSRGVRLKGLASLRELS